MAYVIFVKKKTFCNGLVISDLVICAMFFVIWVSLFPKEWINSWVWLLNYVQIT